MFKRGSGKGLDFLGVYGSADLPDRESLQYCIQWTRDRYLT